MPQTEMLVKQNTYLKQKLRTTFAITDIASNIYVNQGSKLGVMKCLQPISWCDCTLKEGRKGFWNEYNEMNLNVFGMEEIVQL